ncbi:MAG: adenosine deaminase [Bacilli bacterium]|nr:adenosine deaminase [Bacilli bacterium]
MNYSKQFVVGLPKAELHLHLEGTLEPDLKLKLAIKNHVNIGQKTIKEVKASYRFHDLTSFLKVYYPAMNVLQKESDFYDLAWAYLLKAKKNNVKYCELFFDPQAHTSRGVSFKTVINGYYKAVSQAKKLGIEAHLIMCFLRDMPYESAKKTYQQMLPYKNKIIAIGLDSDERNNPPEKFIKIFKQAKKDGLHITMHCDIDQIDSIKHIKTCLKNIGVERIDHGTNIVEDKSLVDFAIKHKIGFTCCPVSNSFVTKDMKGKEIKYLLKKGALVTVNSDDPAYFQSYISDDMYTLATKYKLTKAEMIKLVKNSFNASFMSEKKKKQYLKLVDKYAKAH